MAFGDEFVCPKVRFTFFNGKKHYTVQYSPALRMWFVFDEDMESDCLWKFELKKSDKTECNSDKARNMLNAYFDSIDSSHYATNYNF